jgi:hypothetical protein
MPAKIRRSPGASDGQNSPSPGASKRFPLISNLASIDD